MIIKIITGMAGAGKSTVLNAFEDLGYYCIDNLPPNLLKEFILLYDRAQSESNSIAVVMDLRLGTFFQDILSVAEELKEQGYDIEILFVEADDKALKKRFVMTRRSHPLALRGAVEEGIEKERLKLDEIRQKSDRIIDTSNFNSHQLKMNIQDYYKKKSLDLFTINMVSFGAKHGDLAGADFVFDVRFLPNPFYEEKLSNLTGYDEAVREYIMQESVSKDYFKQVIQLLEIAIPEIRNSGRPNITIGFACTGGRHRSVTFNVLVSEHFIKQGYHVEVTDRELMNA